MAIIKGTKQGDYIDTLKVTKGVVGGHATDGDDIISVSIGNDEVHAGGGRDILQGDLGNDKLYGDDGDDQIDGGGGNDYLQGGAGNDGMVGAAGDDRLFGDDGNDRLNGGAGNDVSTGGTGADVFVISAGRDVVTDFSPLTARDVLLDFEGISGGEIAVPVDYKGLQWPADVPGLSGFTSITASLFGSEPENFPGLMNVYSGKAAAYMAGGSFSFSSASQDFDFVSGDFAADQMPDSGRLDLIIQGLDDGVVVGTVTVEDISELKNSITFGDDFQSIDQVQISYVLVQSPNPGESFRASIAMDDLLLRFYDLNGEKLQVGSAADIAALVASATGDGAGNTVLSQGGNTTTLLGVDPAAVTHDWFVIG